MRVFVTGGSGLLGSAVVNALLERGHTVTAAVRSTSVRDDLDGRAGVEVLEVGLDDVEALVRGIDGHEGLCHVAGAAGRFYRDRRHYERTNVELSRNVFRAARRAGVRRAVYTGTVVIPLGLDNAYANSKRRGAEAAREECGGEMDVVVVHPSGMIGPRDRTPTPLGRAIDECARGRLRTIVNGGSGLIHVDDAGEAHAAALERGDPAHEYVLDHEHWSMERLFAHVADRAGDAPPRAVPLSLASLAARGLDPIARVLGVVPPVNTFVTTYLGLPPVEAGLGDRDRAALGLPPHRPIEVAIDDALRWFDAHRHAAR